MSGGRQTGTVPKTKHNSRARRENPVNHLPNNLVFPFLIFIYLILKFNFIKKLLFRIGMKLMLHKECGRKATQILAFQMQVCNFCSH